MLNRIISFSIENKLIIGLLMFFWIIYGVYQATLLPIDAVPDITDNQVQVITSSPSLGAPDVERFITVPIEQANSNIPGIHQIRSFSRFGLSVITIVFEDGVDIYWARQQVAERIQKAKEYIPIEFGTPEVAPLTTGLGEIYQYSVRTTDAFKETYSSSDLRSIQDWIVRKQLLSVKGVADVASFGGHLKQYEVSVDQNKLLSHEVNISEVFDAIERSNQNTGGSYIEKGPRVLFIRSEGLVDNLDEIKSVFIKRTSQGTPVFIGDVADVKFGTATRYGAMTYNGEGEVSGAVVMMLKGANSNEVIGNVKERIADIQKMLPEGVVIDAFLDRTKMVNNSISTVTKNLLEGALIVIFILVLFLGNFRAGFIVATVIPLSMLFAIILMNLFGVSGNLMSLGALDFGLIVDGAVIIVEAVMHRLTHSKHFRNVERLSKSEMNEEVKSSAGRMMNSAVFGQIIILIVYLPIFTLEGIEGKMFKPMAQTVVFAMIGAFILSLTYVPMMSSLIISRKLSHKKNISDRMMEFLERHYQHWLERVLKIPKLVLTSVALLFAGSIILMSNLGGEFIPSLPEGDFAVDTRVLTGSSLTTSVEAVLKGEKILLEKFPEVEKVVGKTGSSEIPTDPMPIEASDMMIILKDRREWTSAKTYDELAEKMSKELSVIPGVTFSFQYPVAMRFNELMTGARQDVVCKIFGENLDTLSRYAQILGDLSAAVEGSSNLFVEPVTGSSQIVIHYDRSKMGMLGIDVEKANTIVNMAFAGQRSGFVFEGEKRYELVVRLNDEGRKNMEDVRALTIMTNKGYSVPLTEIARVDMERGPNQIQREGAERRIIVGFNVRGRDMQSVVEELKSKVQEKVKLPPGYYITYGGAFENLIKAKERLAIAVPASLLLIFLMLFFALRSVRHGLLIYTAIPLSAMGGIFALVGRGMPFSISAGIGFIALFGVAVLNGIVLVSEFNRLKSEGITDLKRIVVQGTKIRLRPVLMTALVASLGFLPMALSNGEGAEVQRPLATVVIGGLLLATLLTLFVLPLFYVLTETWSNKKPPKPRPLMALLVLLIPSFTNAQSVITMEAAVDSALKRLPEIRRYELMEKEVEYDRRAAFSIDPTEVSYSIGQINSALNDNSFSIRQNLNYPGIYIQKKKLAEARKEFLKWQKEEHKAEVQKRVRDQYMLVSKVIVSADLKRDMSDMLSRIYQSMKLRYENGDIDRLELSAAAMEMFLAQNELDDLILQLNFELEELRKTVGLDQVFFPDTSSFFLVSAINDDISMKKNTVWEQMVNSENLVLQQEKKVSKTNVFPGFFIGYQSMTIQGMGADNNFYTSANRFSSFQAGLSIPLFSKRASLPAKRDQLRIMAWEMQTDFERNVRKESFDLARSEQENRLRRLNQRTLQWVNEAKIMQEGAMARLDSGAFTFYECSRWLKEASLTMERYFNDLLEYHRVSHNLKFYLNQ
jgi:cobalt-zinc-cadmium resistance protein CzcA